jgi:hypothetical protein
MVMTWGCLWPLVYLWFTTTTETIETVNPPNPVTIRMPPGYKPVLLTSTLLDAALRIATDPRFDQKPNMAPTKKNRWNMMISPTVD